jgi:hypothetical protein
MGYAEDLDQVLDALEARGLALQKADGSGPEFGTVLTEYVVPNWDELTFPLLWIIEGEDDIETTGGRRVGHDLKVSAVVVYQSTDDRVDKADIREARRLAGRFYDSLIQGDRSLGLPFVETIEGTKGDPNYNPRSGRILHWRELAFSVKLNRVE